jgi:NADH-quinone oxidoreductase subunit L
MVMGVCSGAYAAGLFHLYTHAFFKALLFMAAGSLIAAMAGRQSLDDMGGFRRAMPFTFGCFIVGGLALSGIPPFSGFFSKDEILLLVGDRGGWHWALYVAGYIGAFLTAVYTFRMIFRAFWGEPVAQARAVEEGHLHHEDVPRNPMTGEEEDTDVGFPGPEHHIAERSNAMKGAMGVLAVGAVLGGLLQIPKVTHVIDHFLEPTFAGSEHFEHEASTGLLTVGLILGAVVGLAGIALAYHVWVRRPGLSTQVRERLAGMHRFFVNKWYFDELIDVVFLRPAAWIGRWASQTFERLVIEGTLVGGTVSVVRAGSAAVRAIQTGFLRYYAALLMLGLGALALYFLLASG